jgi:hypothetical protein
MARFDVATGRYVYLAIDGVEYRVYFEEAGAGIPLLLQPPRAPTAVSGATCSRTPTSAGTSG